MRTKNCILLFVVMLVTTLEVRTDPSSSDREQKRQQSTFSSSNGNRPSPEADFISRSEYLVFLRATASQLDPHHLYSGELENQITCFWDQDHFNYELAAGADDTVPITGLSEEQAMRYCNWIENGALTDDRAVVTTESGSYDLTREEIIVKEGAQHHVVVDALHPGCFIIITRFSDGEEPILPKQATAPLMMSGFGEHGKKPTEKIGDHDPIDSTNTRHEHEGDSVDTGDNSGTASRGELSQRQGIAEGTQDLVSDLEKPVAVQGATDKIEALKQLVSDSKAKKNTVSSSLEQWEYEQSVPCFEKAIKYLNKAIKAMSDVNGNRSTYELWEKAAARSQDAGNKYREAAEAWVSQNENEARYLDSVADVFVAETQAASYKAHASEAEKRGDMELARKWNEISQINQQAFGHLDTSAILYKEGKRNEASAWNSAGNGFCRTAEKLGKAIEAEEVEKPDIASKWREAAALNRSSIDPLLKAATAHHTGKTDEGHIWYRAGFGLAQAAEKLGKAIEAEEVEKPDIDSRWREAAALNRSSIDPLLKAAAAYEAGKTSEGGSWFNAGQGFYWSAKKLGKAIEAEQEGKRDIAQKWHDAAVLQKRSIDPFLKAAAAYEAGKISEGGSWFNAGCSFYNAADRSSKAIEAEVAGKLGEAQKWHDTAALYQNSINPFSRAVQAYGVGKKLEGNSWNNIGASFHNAAEKLEKAIEAEKEKKLEIAQKWRETAVLYQNSINPFSKAAAAYGVGKKLEGNSWNRAGLGFYNAAEKLEKAIEAEKEEKLEIAQKWRKAAALFQNSIDLFLKAASADGAGKTDEGTSWNDAGVSFAQAADNLGKAIEAEAAGKPAIAQLWRKTADLYQSSIDPYLKAVEAYGTGKKLEGNSWNRASLGFVQAAEKLEKAIEDEATGKVELGKSYREAAAISEISVDQWSQSVVAKSEGRGDQYKRLSKIAKISQDGTDQMIKLTSSALKVKADYLAKAAEAESAGKVELANGYREASVILQNAIDLWKRSAETKAEGKENEGISWEKAGSSLQSRADYLAKVAEAEDAGKTDLGNLYREASAVSQNAADWLEQSASVRAKGKESEGNSWYGAGASLQSKADYLAKAAEAKGKGKEELVEIYLQIAKQSGIEADSRKQLAMIAAGNLGDTAHEHPVKADDSEQEHMENINVQHDSQIKELEVDQSIEKATKKINDIESEIKKKERVTVQAPARNRDNLISDYGKEKSNLFQIASPQERGFERLREGKEEKSAYEEEFIAAQNKEEEENKSRNDIIVKSCEEVIDHLSAVKKFIKNDQEALTKGKSDIAALWKAMAIQRKALADHYEKKVDVYVNNRKEEIDIWKKGEIVSTDLVDQCHWLIQAEFFILRITEAQQGFAPEELIKLLKNTIAQCHSAARSFNNKITAQVREKNSDELNQLNDKTLHNVVQGAWTLQDRSRKEFSEWEKNSSHNQANIENLSFFGQLDLSLFKDPETLTNLQSLISKAQNSLGNADVSFDKVKIAQNTNGHFKELENVKHLATEAQEKWETVVQYVQTINVPLPEIFDKAQKLVLNEKISEDKKSTLNEYIEFVENEKNRASAIVSWCVAKQVESLANAAYEKTFELSHKEPGPLWDEAATRRGEAVMAWEKTLEALIQGLAFVPEDRENLKAWWRTQIENVENQKNQNAALASHYMTIRAGRMADTIYNRALKSSVVESVQLWGEAVTSTQEAVAAYNKTLVVFNQGLAAIPAHLDDLKTWWSDWIETLENLKNQNAALARYAQSQYDKSLSRNQESTKTVSIDSTYKDFKIEIEQLRGRADQLAKIATAARDKALNVTAAEAALLWDEASAKRKAVAMAWDEVLKVLVEGLSAIPEDHGEKDWWITQSERAKDTKNRNYTVAIWYMANKAARVADMAYDRALKAAEDVQLWDEAVARRGEVIAAWDGVLKALTEGLAAVPEGRDDLKVWWRKQAQRAENEKNRNAALSIWYMAHKARSEATVTYDKYRNTPIAEAGPLLDEAVEKRKETVVLWDNALEALQEGLSAVPESHDYLKTWWNSEIEKLNLDRLSWKLLEATKRREFVLQWAKNVDESGRYEIVPLCDIIAGDLAVMIRHLKSGQEAYSQSKKDQGSKSESIAAEIERSVGELEKCLSDTLESWNGWKGERGSQSNKPQCIENDFANKRSVWKMRFMGPLIREETVIDSNTGQEREIKMAAEHLMVVLKPNTSKEDFCNALKKLKFQGCGLAAVSEEDSLYRLYFQKDSKLQNPWLDTMTQLQETIRNNDLAVRCHPDYILTLCGSSNSKMKVSEEPWAFYHKNGLHPPTQLLAQLSDPNQTFLPFPPRPIKIAIIDTGIFASKKDKNFETHSALVDKIDHTIDENGRVVSYGYNAEAVDEAKKYQTHVDTYEKCINDNQADDQTDELRKSLRDSRSKLSYYKALECFPQDSNGHGTHVAGIIAAKHGVVNDVAGLAGALKNEVIDGVADGARVSKFVELIICKSNISNTSEMYPNYVLDCVKYAIDNGADIINCSLILSDAREISEIRNYIAKNKSCVVVASSGNGRKTKIGDVEHFIPEDLDQVNRYPASFSLPNLITVAATDKEGNLFTNYGKSRVHVATSGKDIVSAWIGEQDACATMEGSSMAAPYVTAALALVKIKYPLLSSDELVSYLCFTADKQDSDKIKVKYGPLNLKRALEDEKVHAVFNSWYKAEQAGSKANEDYKKVLEATTEETRSLLFGVVMISSKNAAEVWGKAVKELREGLASVLENHNNLKTWWSNQLKSAEQAKSKNAILYEVVRRKIR